MQFSNRFRPSSNHLNATTAPNVKTVKTPMQMHTQRATLCRGETRPVERGDENTGATKTVLVNTRFAGVSMRMHWASRLSFVILIERSLQRIMLCECIGLIRSSTR
jgi:hypothetical protein